MSNTMWFIVGILFVGIVIYAVISVNIDEKKGKTSQVKKDIHDFIFQELGSEGVAMYASNVIRDYFHGAMMSSTTTTVEHYVLGFLPTKNAIYLADISLDEENVIFSRLVCYDEKKIGRVTIVGTYFCLFDKNDEKIVEVHVDPLNTKMDTESVNVTQREEWKLFQEFLPKYANAMNDWNDVPQKYRKWGTVRKDLKK